MDRMGNRAHRDRRAKRETQELRDRKEKQARPEHRGRRAKKEIPAQEVQTAQEVLAQAAREIGEYFEGERRVFTVPTAAAGTPFQQAVWNALKKIPYGETRTYGAVAAAVGRPKAARAVGNANNKNPILIFTP